MILTHIETQDISEARQQHRLRWRAVLNDFYELSMTSNGLFFAYRPETSFKHWKTLVWNEQLYYNYKPGYSRIVNTILSTRVLHIPPPTTQQLLLVKSLFLRH